MVMILKRTKLSYLYVQIPSCKASDGINQSSLQVGLSLTEVLSFLKSEMNFGNRCIGKISNAVGNTLSLILEVTILK